MLWDARPAPLTEGTGALGPEVLRTWLNQTRHRVYYTHDV